ncbi:MAG TPA: SGNH/GDSL hydrolase family protein [Hanamia sp.]
MRIIKIFIISFFVLSTSVYAGAQQKITLTIENANALSPVKNLYKAGDPLFQYYGRIQKTNVDLPRFWSSGVYIKTKFDGNNCSFFLNDQVLYGNVHNYVELIVDGETFRFQTKFAANKITLKGLKKGTHTITICKDTESGQGYLEFAGIACNKLLQLPEKPLRKIEFIGNSITCGYGDDASEIACHKGQWYDQHNAYMAYGPLTARALNAQWELTAVSGIGMIHSCCGMKILMPQVYDKIDLRDDSIAYDFKDYMPELVTICLGQNDGIQDSAAFFSAYLQFIKTIRSKYANAGILLLTSPMADAKLRAVLKNYLSSIEDYLHKNGDQNIYKYFFENQYNHGCDNHPDIKEHQQISDQIVQFIQKNQLLQ